MGEPTKKIPTPEEVLGNRKIPTPEEVLKKKGTSQPTTGFSFQDNPIPSSSGTQEPKSQTGQDQVSLGSDTPEVNQPEQELNIGQKSEVWNTVPQNFNQLSETTKKQDIQLGEVNPFIPQGFIKEVQKTILNTPTLIPATGLYAAEASTNLMRTYNRGVSQGLTATNIKTGGDIQRIAELQKISNDNAPAGIYKELIEQDDFIGVMKVIAKDPVNTLTNLAIESMASQTSGIGSIDGRGVAAGAAAGSVIPVVGTLSGAMTGMAFESSMALETSSYVLEALTKDGYDTTNPEDLEKAFSNKEYMSELKAQGEARGLPVAVLDAISAGIAGKLGGKKLITQLLRETGAQSTLGGAGEASKQIIFEGGITNTAAIALEAAGEIGGGAPEIFTGMLATKPSLLTQPSTDNKDLPTIDKAVSDINKDIEKAPEWVKPELENKAKELTTKKNQMMVEQAKFYDGFSETDQDKIVEINDRLSQIAEIGKDESISQSTKDAYKAEASSLIDEKEQIENGYKETPSVDEKPIQSEQNKTEEPTTEAPVEQKADSESPAQQPIKLKLSEKSPEYTIEKTEGGFKVLKPDGKEASTVTKKKVLKEHAKSIDFTEGKSTNELMENVTVDPNTDIDKIVAETSENPAELAELITRTSNQTYLQQRAETTDQVGEAVISYVQGNVSRDSFVRNSDENNIGFSLAKSYFNKEGRGLDVLAQEISEELGTEITEQDIIDYMNAYPNGLSDLYKQMRDETSNPARAKFTEITGLPATDYYLKLAIDQAVKKSQIESQMTSLDVMSDEELINHYNEIKQSETDTSNETSNEARDSKSNEAGKSIAAKAPKDFEEITPAQQKLADAKEKGREKVKETREKERAKSKEKVKQVREESKEKIKAVKDNFKQGFMEYMDALDKKRKEGRAKIEDISRDIKSFVKENSKEQITPIQSATLIANAAKIKTDKDLEKFKDQANKIFLSAEERQYKSDLKKLKALTKPSKYTESRSRGVKKGKISNYERKVITAANKALVEDNLEALAAQIEAAQYKIFQKDANIEDVSSEMEGLMIAFKAMTQGIEGVRQATEEVKDLSKVGRRELQEVLKKKHKEYQNLKEGVVNSVTQGEGVKSGVDKLNLERKGKAWYRQFMESVDAFMDAHQGLRMMFDIIDKGVRKKGDTFSGFLDENLWAKISDARTNKIKLTEGFEKQIQDKLLDIYGSKKKVREALNNNTREQVIGVFPSLKSKDKELKLTPNRAYHLYNLNKNPDNTDTFEAMGWNSEVHKAVEDSLTPELKEWADWQVDVFYPQMHNQINDVYKKMNYMDLGKPKNYVPTRRESVTEGFEQTIDGFKNSVVNAEYGNLKERQGSKAPFDIRTDGDSTLYQYGENMNHYIAFAEAIKDLNVVFTDKNIREGIKQNNNSKTLSVIEDFIRDIAEEGTRSKSSLQLLDKLRGWHTTSSLGVSPLITIKQLTSAPAYIADIGVRNFLNGSRRFFTNPIETANNLKYIFKNSPTLRDRYKSGWDRDTAQAMRRDYQKTLGGKSTILGTLMFNVKWGDAGGIALGYASWYAHYKKAKKTMPDSEAKEYATAKFEAATDLSQQTSKTEGLSPLQRGGSFAKIFTMYKSSPIQYFAQERKGVRDMIRGAKTGDRQRIKDGARRFVVYHMVLPVIFQWVSNGMMGVLTDKTDDDDKDLVRAMSLGSLNGVFILGDWLAFMGDVITNKGWATKKGGMGIPVFDNISSFGYDVAEIIKEYSNNDGSLERDVVEALRDDAIVDGMDAVGLPAGRLKKTYDAFYSEENDWNSYSPEEQAAIILGYNPRYLQIKKETAKSDKKKSGLSWIPDLIEKNKSSRRRSSRKSNRGG